MHQNATISLFFNIAKFAVFCWKNADVCRTQGMHHVSDTFFGSSLDKV